MQETSNIQGNDKLKAFYDRLKVVHSKFVPNEALPEYDTFRETLNGKEKVNEFYKLLKTTPYGNSIPDNFETFATSLFPESKGWFENTKQPDENGGFLAGVEAGGKQVWGGLKYAAGAVGDMLDSDNSWDWDDDLKRSAKETFDSIPRGEGFLYNVGQLVPQGVGILAAVLSAPLTGGSSLSSLPAIIGGTNLATLTGSAVGNAMKDYDDYMEEKGEEGSSGMRLTAGVLNGAFELLFEKIGMDKVPALKNLGKLTTRRVTEVIMKNSPEIAEGLLERYVKSVPGGMAKITNLAGKMGRQGLIEGGEEAATEIAQDLATYIYKDKEDRTGFGQLMENTFHAFMGGAMMGSMIGVASDWATNKMNQQRREKNGVVVLGMDVNNKTFEIIDEKDGVLSVIDPYNNVVQVNEDQVAQTITLTPDEFNHYLNDFKDNKDAVIEDFRKRSERQEESLVMEQMRQFDEKVAGITSENGMIQSVNINGSEDAVYIVKGDVVPKVLNDGKTVIDVDKSSAELYYADEEGKMQVVTPANVTAVLSVDPVDGLRQQFEQSIREQIQLSKEMQAQQSMIDNIQNGDEVMYQNEKGEVVKGVVEDAVSNPEHVFVNGVAVPRDMVRPVKSVEPKAESMPEQPTGTVQDVPVETTPEYPMTKDGKVDYNTLLDQNPELFAEAWEKRSTPEKAKATLQRQSDNIAKKIESLNSKLDKEIDLNRISDIEDEIFALEKRRKSIDDVISSRYMIDEKNEQLEQSSGIDNENNILDSDGNLLSSSQETNEQENGIPEQVSQGEHGTEASEDGGQKESPDQLRRRIEEASRDARESKSGRSEGRRAEEEINRFIESESKKNGVWVPIEDISNIGSPFVSGNENDVYLDRENGVLYKVNNLMNSGTLPELFKRIDLHNKFFPDTKYDLVGFTGFGDVRAVYPIYKQEFVDNAVFASPEEINDYMHSIGFERTGEAEYSNNEVTISDLRPRNVLKDLDGDIYVIDADFKAKEQQAENPINTEIERQELEVNTDPTEEQKEAGNYKMGHVKINGFDVTIEQPKGSVRSGTDQYGKEWSVTMNNTYGYIRGTKGKDGDHIDVFVGPNPESGNVFVIDQVNHDGSFDEHKVMMGFDSIDEAKAAYLSNYEDGWNGFGNITGVELEDFRKWVDTGTRKLKPFAEYKQVQESSHVIDSDISTSEYKPKDGKPIRFTKWKDGGLITKDDGQFCLIERVFTESGAFSFTSKKKIKSSNDVAYIFRQLETSSIENAFVVMVKKGKPVVIHAGMGTLNQTMVNNAAIKAAYDSIGPDYVAFVHNHPSGRLMASLQDQKALKTIKDMFPEGLVVDGIIINTISGEYATFDFSGSETSKMDDVVNNEIPIKLYSFDKVVFDENYDPRNTKKIKSSDDVAAFVSSQRLGKRGKLSYIIIDQSGGIVGNLHTLYAGIEGNENAIANEISSNVIRFGGVSAIPYGDFVLDSSTLKELNRDISKASGGAVSLLDVVKIDGLHTESAIDNGVMESIENYQSGGGMDNDIRFRESVSENLEEVNNRFNEDLQQQIDGKLPKGYVYQLGRPSEALRSAGILDSEIEMSASRLLLKSSKDYKSDHPFDLSEVINLPNAIQKPIAVFESETDPRRTVVLTELKSKNDNFLVILDVIRDGRRNQVNSVISLYPKNSSVRVGKWFDSKNQNDIGRDLLKWVDKEKALKWLSGHSSNVNATGLSSKRIASIINNFENPTIEQGEISSEIDRMSDDLGVGVRRVRDKKDLPDNVQERMKNGRYPGMFDPKTGEVYIVMNEISDLADAQATMLHEIVGHKGIHGLFGERLPEFCDQVLSSMEEGEAKRFIDLANGNKQLAAEEYVSSFAEGYTDPMTWEKVKAIVKDFFRKMGIDLKLSDNDLKYILWKGKNRLKEGDSAMTTMNKVVRDDVVWRNIQGEKEVEKVREAAEEIDFDNEDKLKFHNLISGGLFKFREGYQDRMLSVKKMQDVIEEKTGVKLPDYMNVYIYENTLSSRNTHETEFFRNNYLRPMTRAISELEESGLSRREIENYVILKHGLERNEYMNQREETKGVDYAGIEMVENELNEKVEDFIKRVEGHGVDELWKAINDANHFSIKKWFDSGMINKATYEKIRGMYEHYVPLRGFDEETASDVYEYFTSAGSPFNSPLRTAEGRRSRADSPFAYIASMAESSITGGNKNLMKLHLYRLAQKYPSGFMSVSEPWYEKVKRDGKEVYEMRVPVYSDDIDVYRENVEKFNEEMKRLESEGLAVKGKGRLDVGMKISPFEADEHIVRVRLNGEDKVIYFHGDPRPAQAINGLNDESRKAGNTTRDKLYRSVGKLNRAMAANFTTRNPAFVVSNMTRDLIFAITALNIKEGGTYRNKFMLNIPKASGAICRYLNGNQDLSNPVDKMFKEFLENGGETGYTALYNIEKFKKMIDREVKKTTMNSAVKGGIRVIDFFSAANRWAEDLSRFSTFMTSREMGRSVLRSTADAKDVTVNFNRKGSGAMGAGFFRGLYLFFNAAVQSLDNFGRMGKAHKAKTFFTVMGYGAMGAVLPTLLRAMMGDDAEKEYCDLPDYVRKNNVCIYMGKGNGFLTIPLPIELRAFFGIGDAIYQCITGRNEGLSTAGDCLSGLIDLLPLNPVGGGGPLIPDAIKPIAQAYALNEDFTGKPIAKENAFNQLIPEYRKVYRGTSKWFVKSSEVLNSVTGGDFATRGLIDINPAKVEHLFESYFGGMEKTINQIFKTAFGDTEGKREARNVPIVNRFYNTGGDFAATAKVNERYFNVLDEVKEIDTRLREYNKAIASGENVDKALKGIKELVDDGSLERSKIVSFYAKEVKKIDNMIKSGNLSDDDMENLKEESMKVKRMLLDELRKLEP